VPVVCGSGLQNSENRYTALPMAKQTDNSQMMKLGLVLLGLGALMAIVNLAMTPEAKWQLYGGIGAAVLGIAVVAMAKLKK
jgi:hypothetical protein